MQRLNFTSKQKLLLYINNPHQTLLIVARVFPDRMAERLQNSRVFVDQYFMLFRCSLMYFSSIFQKNLITDH